jgi:site-specific DNA-cytosine methylase
MMRGRSILAQPIPVIDIFAGPGGLNEGFAGLHSPTGPPAFEIALSIEKDRHAHSTLELRAFFRLLNGIGSTEDYYRYIWGPDHPAGMSREKLFSLHPQIAAVARERASAQFPFPLHKYFFW